LSPEGVVPRRGVPPKHAAAEFIFEGTHTGEFAGIPATGKKVHVPYTAFYDLHYGKITGLRLYGFGALIQQLQA
jgi:predicted ester cyclase